MYVNTCHVCVCVCVSLSLSLSPHRGHAAVAAPAGRVRAEVRRVHALAEQEGRGLPSHNRHPGRAGGLTGGHGQRQNGGDLHLEVPTHTYTTTLMERSLQAHTR